MRRRRSFNQEQKRKPGLRGDTLKKNTKKRSPPYERTLRLAKHSEKGNHHGEHCNGKSDKDSNTLNSFVGERTKKTKSTRRIEKNLPEGRT